MALQFQCVGVGGPWQAFPREDGPALWTAWGSECTSGLTKETGTYCHSGV